MCKAVLSVFLLLSLFAAANASSWASAWVGADGSVATSSQFFNVTKIDIGHYCVNTANMGTYAPVFVTLQTNGGNPPFDLIPTANTGWGDACNPYSILSVFVSTVKGAPVDSAFSVLVQLM